MLLPQVNLKSSIMNLDIGKVSKQAKMPASTLRYYEEIGLIKPVGRRGLKRIYSEDVLEKLAFITLGRVAGLSLEEIGSMFLSDDIDVDRELLLSKADELDRRIKQLSSMRDGLRHAANCSAPNHFECQKFLRLLKIATKKWNNTIQKDRKLKPT